MEVLPAARYRWPIVCRAREQNQRRPQCSRRAMRFQLRHAYTSDRIHFRLLLYSWAAACAQALARRHIMKQAPSRIMWSPPTRQHKLTTTSRGFTTSLRCTTTRSGFTRRAGSHRYHTDGSASGAMSPRLAGSEQDWPLQPKLWPTMLRNYRAMPALLALRDDNWAVRCHTANPLDGRPRSRQLNPLGCTPVLEHTCETGIVLLERQCHWHGLVEQERLLLEEGKRNRRQKGPHSARITACYARRACRETRGWNRAVIR